MPLGGGKRVGNEILSHIRAESVRRLLRPLVRLFLRGSGRIQEFYEISKEVFADVAEEELERAGKRVTLSKLSIVTGLQRRDLRRIHAEGNQARPQAKNPLGRIITQWAQDERFTTSAGKPPKFFAGTRRKRGCPLIEFSSLANLYPRNALSLLANQHL